MELEHAIGFSGAVKGGSIHLHPSGDTAVYALGAQVVIASLRDAHDQSFLVGHDDHVTCLALSKSGRTIISGQQGDNADVIIWDFESRRIIYRLQEHDIGVKLVTLSDDERFLLTIGADKKMVVWDMTTGMIVAKQSGIKHTMCACWGGRRLDTKRRATTDYQFATGGDANLTYWALDAMAGTLSPEECTLGNQVRNFTALAFSIDEEYMFAGSSSSDFTAVHVKHKVLHSTTVCGSGGVQSMIAMRTHNGDRVIVGCGDGSISVFEGQRNGAQTCRTYQRGPAEACTVMLDGSVSALQLRGGEEQNGELKLLAGTCVGSVFAVSLSVADHRAMSAPPAYKQALQESHAAAVLAVSYARDSSEIFATASADGSVRVWDVNTYAVIAKGSCQTPITGPPSSMAFTGEVLFTGWGDGKIRAHDADSGKELWAIDHCHQDGVTSLTASHNKKFLVSGGEHGEVRVWEIRTREMIVNLKQHTSAVTSLTLFGDDSHVVSGSRDRTIYLWDLQTESRKASLMQRMGGVNAVALMPDHVQLATVGQEKSVSFWDLREPDPLKFVPCGSEYLCIAAYTPPSAAAEPSADACEKTVFATAGVDGVVRLWGFKQARVLAEGVGHSGPVRSVQFSPDGRQLVSVGDDGAVLVWNLFLEDDPPQ